MDNFRGALTAVQSAFDKDNILVIEVEHDDVRVYVKRGHGKQRIDVDGCFEDKIFAAAEYVREPQQG